MNKIKLKERLIFDLYPEKLADKFRNQDREVLESGKILELQEKYRVQDTSEMFIQIMKKPIEDEKGKIVGILGFFEDITEKMLLQQEIFRSAQLTSIGELATSIALSSITR